MSNAPLNLHDYKLNALRSRRPNQNSAGVATGEVMQFVEIPTDGHFIAQTTPHSLSIKSEVRVN